MRSRKALTWCTAIFGFGIVLAIVAVSRPHPPTFAFVNSDHPIDMWEEGKDRWAYFGAGGNRKWPELVAAARAELVPQGFVEDRSRLPWICFTKDHYEVVLTDHQAFAVNATGMFKGKLIRRAGATPNEWPCVLVKNGPGTSGPMTAYQLKKLVLRW